SGFFHTQQSILDAQRPTQISGRRMLGVERWAFSFWRVKGAWWSSRSSKPLSVPHTRDRGRFDSYPLRLKLSRHQQREAESKDPVAISKGISTGFVNFAQITKIQRR